MEFLIIGIVTAVVVYFAFFKEDSYENGKGGRNNSSNGSTRNKRK